MGEYAAAAATRWAEDSSTEDNVEEAVAATAAASRERESLPGAAGKRKRKKRSGAVRLSRAIATHRGIEEMAKAKGFHLVQEQAAIAVSNYEKKRGDAYHKALIARREATLSDLLRAAALESDLRAELLRSLPKPRGSIAPAPSSSIPTMWRPLPSCFIPTQTQDLSPPPRPSQAWPQPPLADSPQTPTFPSSPAEARDLAGLRYLRAPTPPFKGPPPLKGPPPSKGPPPFKGPPPRPCLKQVRPRPSSNQAAHSQW